MSRNRLGLVLLLAFGLPLAPAQAIGWRKDSAALLQLNHKLAGKIIDHTANHGRDRRIWSPSLGQRRDLYIYLPPHYDKNQRYPIIMLLHGFSEDEQSLFRILPALDKAMATGKLPPAIIAAPDGSLKGEPSLALPGSFFLNTEAGWFEDFLLQDVWDHVCRNYPIRPEREAHVLAGVSMGGFAAFNLGIRHRYAFGTAIGVFPPLNLRWVNALGDYFGDFDPLNWGWRDSLDRKHEVIARFNHGLVKVRLSHFIEPLFGFCDEAIQDLSRVNPIELVDRTRLRNGELDMYVAYGGKDEFNVDAQVESFLYLCKHRGLGVGVGYDPEGRHDLATAMRLLPGIIEWLAPRLAPYAPCTSRSSCPPCLP